MIRRSCSSRSTSRLLPRAQGRPLRLLAWGVVAAGIVLPVVRRRLRTPPLAVVATAAAAPFALALARPRSAKRDAAIYALQMWAFIVGHELPNDDPIKLEQRTRVDYPVSFDERVFGRSVNVSLQRSVGRPGRTTTLDYSLSIVHWAWFVQPHAALAWILWRHPQRFPRSAAMMAAVFDIGMLVYFLVPTAPPWWASERGRLAPVRRVMVEVGTRLWGRLWSPMYGFLGSNPVAAMPSLHFASSVMAAHLLSESGSTPGAIGWTYAGTLGFALVYLGEHYTVDLAAGLALTEAVRLLEPAFESPFGRAASLVGGLGKRVSA